MTRTITRKKMFKKRQHKHVKHRKKIKQMEVVLMKIDWNIVMCWKYDRGYFLKETIKLEGKGMDQ